MKMKKCCSHGKKDKKCVRVSDKKTFSLPRRFTRKRCLQGPIKGFSMRSSCAPYRGCSIMKTRKKRRKNKRFKRDKKKYMKSKK